MTDGSAPTNITGVHTIGVPVSDQARSLEFHVEKFGLEKRRDAPFGEGRWLEVAPQGAVTSIALAPPPAGPRSGSIPALA